MADFGSSFAQGVSTGSEIVVRAQQLKLQKLQQERARLLEPMQMKAMEQQNTLMALKIKQAELEQTYTVQIETAFTEVADLLSKADLTNPKVQSQVLEKFAATPWAMRDPRFKALMDVLNDAQELAEMRSRVRGQTSLPADLATTEMATEIRLKLEDPNLSPQERRRYTVKLEELRLATADKEGMTVYDPATGKPLLTTGKVKTFTPASIKQMNTTETLLSSLDYLESLMTTETMGVGGKFWDAIGSIFGQTEKAKAMLSSGSISSVENRQKFEVEERNVKAKIIHTLRSDGNINQKELDRLESIPPGDWVFDNPLTGKARLKGIKRMIVEAMRQSYDRPDNGGPPLRYKPEMLKPKELASNFIAGTVDITEDQLINLLKVSPYDEEKQAAFKLLEGATSGQP